MFGKDFSVSKFMLCPEMQDRWYKYISEVQSDALTNTTNAINTQNKSLNNCYISIGFLGITILVLILLLLI